MGQVAHRIRFLGATVNMFRLLRLLARCAPHHTLPVLPLGKEHSRPCGVTIAIRDTSVVKCIKAFSTQPNITMAFEDLCQVRCPPPRLKEAWVLKRKWCGKCEGCGEGVAGSEGSKGRAIRRLKTTVLCSC